MNRCLLNFRLIATTLSYRCFNDYFPYKSGRVIEWVYVNSLSILCPHQRPRIAKWSDPFLLRVLLMQRVSEAFLFACSRPTWERCVRWLHNFCIVSSFKHMAPKFVYFHSPQEFWTLKNWVKIQPNLVTALNETSDSQ
jgi:hypothetical protein